MSNPYPFVSKEQFEKLLETSSQDGFIPTRCYETAKYLWQNSPLIPAVFEALGVKPSRHILNETCEARYRFEADTGKKPMNLYLGLEEARLLDKKLHPDSGARPPFPRITQFIGLEIFYVNSPKHLAVS